VNVVDSNNFNGYDLARALNSLGPADRGSHTIWRHMQYYTYVISNIAMTVLRVINYAYDCLFSASVVWYNNRKVREIVKEFIYLPVDSPLRENIDLHRKMRTLWEHLGHRNQGFTTIPYNLSLEIGDELVDPNITLIPDIVNHSIGNLDEGIAIEDFIFPDLPQRSYDEFDELGHSTGIGGCDGEFDSSYEGIKDQYALFKIAIEQAIRELGLDRNVPEQSRLQVCRLAVYNLHKQAKLIGSEGSEDIPASCHPIVYYSKEFEVFYQNPRVSRRLEEDQPRTYFSYQEDLFSSKDVGCDPVSLKRLLEKYRGQEALIKCALRQQDPENYIHGHEQRILCDLIETMASQVNVRYFDKVQELIIASPSDCQAGDINGPFEQYIANLRTPYEIMRHSMLYAANALAKEGLIINDPEVGYCSDLTDKFTAKKQVCLRAVFHLCQVLKPNDGLSFALNDHVRISCGKYNVYEQSPTEPFNVWEHERRLVHMFAGDNADTYAGDPLRAACLLKRLDERGQVFMQEYLERSVRDANFRSLFIANENGQDLSTNEEGQPIPLTPGDLAILKRRREIEREFALISLQETKNVISELENEMLCMTNYTLQNDYKKAEQWICQNITFPEGPVRPVATRAFAARVTSEKYHQDVLFEYVEDGVRDKITIKQREVRTYPLAYSYQVHEDEVVNREGIQKIKAHLSQRIFNRQFKLVSNPTGGQSCMFGSLAIEIFGRDAQSNPNFYAKVLRRTAAKYMRAHKEDYRGAMNVRRSYNETQEAYTSRLDAVLLNFCNSVETNFHFPSSDLEQDAIARVFGVEIALYKSGWQFEVGTEGIEQAMLLPTTRICPQFAGAPIRIHLTATNYTSHFDPIAFQDGLF